MEPIELARYRYSRMNPFALPDRRYRISRACQAYGLRPSFCRDDKPTWQLWRFLKQREAAIEPDQYAGLLMAHPGLSVAFQLHHGKRRDLKPLIEAYILGSADDESLAKRLAVPPEAIYWFRLAFFDIEHLRKAPLHVIHHLIGITDQDGHGVLDLHSVWRLLGYKCKAGAGCTIPRRPGRQGRNEGGGLAAWFSRQTQSALNTTQFLAVSKLNTNDPKVVGTLLKLLAQQQRGQRQTEPELNSLERHINATGRLRHTG